MESGKEKPKSGEKSSEKLPETSNCDFDLVEWINHLPMVILPHRGHPVDIHLHQKFSTLKSVGRSNSPILWEKKARGPQSNGCYLSPCALF
jgi:hypothetical protein